MGDLHAVVGNAGQLDVRDAAKLVRNVLQARPAVRAGSLAGALQGSMQGGLQNVRFARVIVVQAVDPLAVSAQHFMLLVLCCCPRRGGLAGLQTAANSQQQAAQGRFTAAQRQALQQVCA
jgi:hypothetical protein